MTIEVALVISIISVSAAVCFGIANYKRNKSKDDKEDAGQQAKIITKLDAIDKNVEDIKEEFKNLKAKVEEDHDRIIRLEESSKQAHKRLDEIGRKEV